MQPEKPADPEPVAAESGVHRVASAADAPMPAHDRYAIHGALDELLAAWADQRKPSRYWADVRAGSYELAEQRQTRGCVTYRRRSDP
jgi:hypothetical protein